MITQIVTIIERTPDFINNWSILHATNCF